VSLEINGAAGSLDRARDVSAKKLQDAHVHLYIHRWYCSRGVAPTNYLQIRLDESRRKYGEFKVFLLVFLVKMSTSTEYPRVTEKRESIGKRVGRNSEV
jgi:hypothetical protein